MIANSHALVRAGLRALLEKIPNVVIAGEAGTLRDSVIAARTKHADAVFAGPCLLEGSATKFAAKLHRECPGARVVILTTREVPEAAPGAPLVAGSPIWLGKDATVFDLGQLARKLSRSNASAVAGSRRVADSARMASRTQPHSLTRLTPRQREILRLIAEGNSTKEIAYQLKVSVKTVETHRSHLMERLNIYNVPGLVRYAMRIGLITWDS